MSWIPLGRLPRDEPETHPEDLSPRIQSILERHTPPSPARYREQWHLTDWFLVRSSSLGARGGPTWVRHAWDTEGLSETWYPVGSVWFDRTKQARHWSWMARLTSGTRRGPSYREGNLSQAPLEAMRRVDAFIGLCNLWSDEYRGHLHGEDLPPYSESMRYGSHCLLSWHHVLAGAHGRFDPNKDRWVRPWTHTQTSMDRLAPRDQTDAVSQRVYPGTCTPGALMTRRGDSWNWSVRVGSEKESGEGRDMEHSLDQVRSTLRFLGCSVSTPVPAISGQSDVL